MGMSVKLELPPIEVEIEARIQRGMLAAGGVVLLIAEAGAPEEPTPKHDVHLRDTGFVRMDGEATVVVGFEAFWALWQELNTDYHHEVGHAKFLELAFGAGAAAAFEQIAAALRA